MANRDDQKDRRPQGLSWGGSAAATKSEPPVESGRDVKGVFGQGKVAQSSPPGESQPPAEVPKPAPLPPMKSLSSAPPKGSFLPKNDAVDDLFSGEKAAPQPAVRTEESTLAVLGSWASVKPKSDAESTPDAAGPEKATDPRSGVAGAFSLSSLRGDGKKRNPLAATMMGVSPPPAMSAAPPATSKAPAAPPPAGGGMSVPAAAGEPAEDAAATPVTDVLERPTAKPPAGYESPEPAMDDLDAALPPVDEEQTDPGAPSAALLAAAEEPPYPEEEVTVAAAATYPNADGSLSQVLPEAGDDLFSGEEPLLAPPPPVELSSEPPELLEYESDAPPPEPPAPPGLADTMVQHGGPPAAPEPPSKLHNTLVGNGPKPQELEELFAAAGLKPAEPEAAPQSEPAKPAKADKPRKPITRGEPPVTSAEPPRRRLSFTQRALLLGSLAGLLGGGLIALLRHQQAAAPLDAPQAVEASPQPTAAAAQQAPAPPAPVPVQPEATEVAEVAEQAPAAAAQDKPVAEAKPAAPVEEATPEPPTPEPPAATPADEPLLPAGMSHGALLRLAEREADPKRAEAMLRALLERKPRDHHVMEPLVRLLLRDGRGTEAVPLAEKMVAKRSRRASYRELLGDARRLAGDGAGAQEAYRKALELDPSNSRVRQRVGGD